MAVIIPLRPASRQVAPATRQAAPAPVVPLPQRRDLRLEAARWIARAAVVALLVQAVALWHATYGTFLPNEVQTLGEGAGSASSRILLLLVPGAVGTWAACRTATTRDHATLAVSVAGLVLATALAVGFVLGNAPVVHI